MVFGWWHERRRKVIEAQQRKAENRQDFQEIFEHHKHAAFRDKMLEDAPALGKAAGEAEAAKRLAKYRPPTPGAAPQRSGWGSLVKAIEQAGGNVMSAYENDAKKFGSKELNAMIDRGKKPPQTPKSDQPES